jgi:hypothetical protein
MTPTKIVFLTEVSVGLPQPKKTQQVFDEFHMDPENPGGEN